MADANQIDETSTSRIQMIAAGQIANQARLCAANLDRVRDKIESINGDMTEISNSLTALKEQFSTFVLNVTKEITTLNSEIRSVKDALNAEVKAVKQASKQRWSIWDTLKEVLLVVLALVSMVISIMALRGSL